MGPVDVVYPTASEAIRQRIGELRAVIRELEDVLIVCGELSPLPEDDPDPEFAPEDPADEPAPPARKPRAPGKARAPAGPGRETAATRALKALADGPLGVAEIAAKTGDHPGAVGLALRKSPWFAKKDPANRLSPYQLTEAGRQALADLGPAAE